MPTTSPRRDLNQSERAAARAHKAFARLFRRRASREVIALFAEAGAVGFEVLDAAGSVVFTTAPDLPVTGEQVEPVRFDRADLGRVRAGASAPRIAAFISRVFAQHHATRSVTREALLRYKELTLLYDFAGKVAARSHTVREAAELILDEARTLIAGDRFYVLVDSGDGLQPGASAGEGSLEAAARATEAARAVLAHEGSEVVHLEGPAGRTTDMLVPIRTPDHTIGALGICTDGEVDYSSDEIKLATALALIGAMAIENARFIETTRRFVPKEFLRSLGHESIPDVRLGDQSEAEIAVMFCDIRGFTSLVETLTPAQAFAFINAFLGLMGPVIRRHGGFVDKYLGDAILAIFPDGSCDAAVAAAVDAQRTAARFNEVQGNRWGGPIRVGCGVHVGPSMLGIIGESERWSGTVISDAVNVAQRVETLTKTVGCDVLISEAAHARLSDPERHHLRRVGLMALKGKAEPIAVYDVFDADPAPLREAKVAARPHLGAAVAAYEAGEVMRTFEHLQRSLQACPDDRLSQLMLERLRQRRAGPRRRSRRDTIPE